MQYLQAHRIQGDYDARMTKDVVATGLWMLVVEGDVGLGKFCYQLVSLVTNW